MHSYLGVVESEETLFYTTLQLPLSSPQLLSTCCLRARCIRCCRHTNMLLSSDDVASITRLGYKPMNFVEEHDGWLQLKNAQGRCVFHTGKRCGIYDHRPAGCRLYPIVYDDDARRAILDADCPQRHKFHRTTKNADALAALIATLQRERAQRDKNSSPKNKKSGKPGIRNKSQRTVSLYT